MPLTSKMPSRVCGAGRVLSGQGLAASACVSVTQSQQKHVRADLDAGATSARCCPRDVCAVRGQAHEVLGVWIEEDRRGPNFIPAVLRRCARPVLLSDPNDFETWLSGSTDEAFKLARSYAADQMRIVQSGSERKDLLAA
jgi:hypothetical protein